jgi:pantoate--beta-alanine ligase
MPTFRAENGLAMSSRNVYLSETERKIAPMIYQTLKWLKETLLSGATNYQTLEKEARLKLEKAGFAPDYVVIRETETLSEVLADEAQKVILVAAKLGKTRLIDNIRV